MKTGRPFVKMNKEKIAEAYTMRVEKHMSYTAIAKHFKCDHTTIMYHLKKENKKKLIFEFICVNCKKKCKGHPNTTYCRSCSVKSSEFKKKVYRKPKIKNKYHDVKLNEGKSYEDYKKNKFNLEFKRLLDNGRKK